MDKTAHYRNLIKKLLSYYAELVGRQLKEGEQTLLAFDEQRDQYLWVQPGWTNHNRVYGVTVHAQILDGKNPYRGGLD